MYLSYKLLCTIQPHFFVKYFRFLGRYSQFASVAVITKINKNSIESKTELNLTAEGSEDLGFVFVFFLFQYDSLWYMYLSTYLSIYLPTYLPSIYLFTQLSTIESSGANCSNSSLSSIYESLHKCNRTPCASIFSSVKWERITLSSHKVIVNIYQGSFWECWRSGLTQTN